jgi:hypothetical protein
MADILVILDPSNPADKNNFNVQQQSIFAQLASSGGFSSSDFEYIWAMP